MTQQHGGDRWLSQSRKIAFWAGLLGLAYETVYEEVDRPWLFLVFLTMMGLAQFSRVFELLGKQPSDGITIKLGRTGSPPPPQPEEGGTVP